MVNYKQLAKVVELVAEGLEFEAQREARLAQYTDEYGYVRDEEIGRFDETCIDLAYEGSWRHRELLDELAVLFGLKPAGVSVDS